MTATRSFTFLGTGTSVGVPMLGCDCAVCTSSDPRNHRYRCSVLVRIREGHKSVVHCVAVWRPRWRRGWCTSSA